MEQIELSFPLVASHRHIGSHDTRRLLPIWEFMKRRCAVAGKVTSWEIVHNTTSVRGSADVSDLRAALNRDKNAAQSVSMATLEEVRSDGTRIYSWKVIDK